MCLQLLGRALLNPKAGQSHTRHSTAFPPLTASIRYRRPPIRNDGTVARTITPFPSGHTPLYPLFRSRGSLCPSPRLQP